MRDASEEEERRGAEGTTTDRRGGRISTGLSTSFLRNRFVWCGFAVRASTQLRPNRRLSRKLWHYVARTRERQRKCKERGADGWRRKERESRRRGLASSRGRDATRSVSSPKSVGTKRERAGERERDSLCRNLSELECLPRLSLNQGPCAFLFLTSWRTGLFVNLFKN